MNITLLEPGKYLDFKQQLIFCHPEEIHAMHEYGFPLFSIEGDIDKVRYSYRFIFYLLNDWRDGADLSWDEDLSGLDRGKAEILSAVWKTHKDFVLSTAFLTNIKEVELDYEDFNDSVKRLWDLVLQLHKELVL